jgi:transposase
MSKHIKKPAGETRRYVGIDLGDKKSRVCVVDEQGTIVTQEWVVTTPEAFLKRFGSEVAMCITMEVGTHSRWASDLLGRCGHDVRVADARQLALITNSDAKSDKRMRGRWRSCSGRIRVFCHPSSIGRKHCRWI